MAEHTELVDGRYVMFGDGLGEALNRPCARAIRCATEFGWKVLTALARRGQRSATIVGLDRGRGEGPLAPGTPGYPYQTDPDIEETARVLLGAALVGSGGALERARAAITEHLTRGTSTAMALAIAPAPLREANRPRWIARTHDAPDPRNESIFMLVRAPDPVRVDDTGTGEIGNGKDGEREPQGSLRERHYVRAHRKRQAHGPGGRLRKIVCIEGYWRGPEPDDEHLTLERMAEHHHPSGETRE